MATVYIEVASGNASGGSLGERTNPYHWPDDKATAETAAGEGGKILMLDGTYTSFSGLGGTIDDITWEAENTKGATVSGLSASANSDGHVKINKCYVSSGINLNVTNAQDMTFNECTWTVKPSNQSDEGTLIFNRCSFPYGYYFSVGVYYNHYMNYCSIYQPTVSRLNGNNQSISMNNCIISCVSNNDQSGDLDWYSALSSNSNNWVHNWDSYNSGDSWIVGDSDPLFEDPENGNLNLRPLSPCLRLGS